MIHFSSHAIDIISNVYNDIILNNYFDSLTSLSVVEANMLIC